MTKSKQPMRTALAAAAILCLAGLGVGAALPSSAAQEAASPQSGQATGPRDPVVQPTTGRRPAAAVGKGDGVTTQPDGNALTFGEAVTALGKLFVAAVILESAFAVIFRSKLYQEFFNGRGLTTPLLVVLCYMVASAFGIDRVLNDILSGLAPAPPGAIPAETAGGQPGGWSTFLTALTIAGGSAGVNSMLQAFGYRVPPPTLTAQRPPETEAWISVRVIDSEGRAVPVIVSIETIVDPTVPHLREVAGIVRAGTVLGRLRRLLFPDQLRFPRYGGHTLVAGTVYSISAAPLDCRLVTDPIIASFARRSIVDFVVVAKPTRATNLN